MIQARYKLLSRLRTLVSPGIAVTLTCALVLQAAAVLPALAQTPTSSQIDIFRNLPPDQVMQLAGAHSSEVWLMYITREDRYVPVAEWIERQPEEPVHRVTVDGGDVLKIYRLR